MGAETGQGETTVRLTLHTRSARPHSGRAQRREADDDQGHRAEFWDLEAALDEGRQRSQ
jgi:hypothetical protein